MAGFGIKPEIHAVEIEGRLFLFPGFFDGDDLSTAETVGDIDFAVESEAGMIGAELGVLLGEALEPGLMEVGGAVAVGVLEVGNFSREGDDGAPFPGEEAGDEEEFVREDFGGFIQAIAVLVREDADPREGWLTGGGAEGVIGHFDDPEIAVFVEGDGDGVDDLRFGSDEFDREIGIELEGGEGICGRERAAGGGIEGRLLERFGGEEGE